MMTPRAQSTPAVEVKGKIKMATVSGGYTCCVPGCFNNNKRDKHLSFYKFPKNKGLRKMWLEKISRKSFSPTSGHKVCSEHFEGGKKTYLNNIPVVFPLAKSHQKPKKPPRRKLIRHETRTDREGVKSDIKEVAPEKVESIDTEETITAQQEIDGLTSKLQDAIHANKVLNSEVLRLKFGLNRFKHSNDDMNYYTGMTYHEFEALYNFLNYQGTCHRLNYWGSHFSEVQYPEIDKRGPKRSLEPKDELFLALCRLRVNIPEKFLADNFNISISEISRIFATWIDLMYSRFIQLPVWATKETVQKNMPEVFRVKYPKTRIIIDCTELFIEKPSCFRSQSETYSTYKSHNTAKGLIGIAPNGAITYISNLYGGHCSDRAIVEHCGLLLLLEEDDYVMADRGFEIEDLLIKKRVHLNIPPFMRGKDSLNPDEEDETRDIASVRIHVERAIERVKNYNILKQIIPNSMSEDLNKVWTVCSLLTNFKGPLVA